ncbi:hypothetical protein [Streptomyces sp. NPDC048196]|uniref:hypothetical protein n=1 Tax=Streptomyces sp. NPDC048196 TaxID=3154712 RepID=UPI0033C2C097
MPSWPTASGTAGATISTRWPTLRCSAAGKLPVFLDQLVDDADHALAVSPQFGDFTWSTTRCRPRWCMHRRASSQGVVAGSASAATPYGLLGRVGAADRVMVGIEQRALIEVEVEVEM